VCSYNDGWITESLKEEVICTLEIPVQDLLSLPSNEILQVNLPFKYTEQRKAKIMKTLGVSEETLNTPNIRLKFNNLSSVKSYFAPPYGDYVEGVKMDTDTFTKQGMKLGLARIRRIISYIILFFRDMRSLFHFKYPFFSYICALVNFFFSLFTNIFFCSYRFALLHFLMSQIAWPSFGSSWQFFAFITTQESKHVSNQSLTQYFSMRII